MSKVIKVVNEVGRSFNVRRVEKGDSYGLDVKKTHGGLDPLIEFYDATNKGGNFGDNGQLVCRYYASTLNEKGGYENGLNLDMGIEEWSVSKENMDEVIKELC